MNSSTKQKQTHRDRKRTDGYQRGKASGRGINNLGLQTTVWKRDVLQGLAIWHRELYSIFYNKPEDFPGGSDGEASVYNAGDPGLSPGSGRSPGEGNGNPLQDSCLEDPMDRGAW